VPRFRYATEMTPPAPFVVARLAHLTEPLETADRPSQLDYGADRTVIPARYVEELELRPNGEVMVAGLGGDVVIEPIYPVRLTIVGLEPVEPEVLAIEGEKYTLIERDVLNRFRAVLDGPRLSLEIE
jgi:hypothetical protein